MRYSEQRPEGYFPSVVNGHHHCYRRDCEWYYDGSTARRAFLPRYVAPWVEPDPPGKTRAEKFIELLKRQIIEERRRGQS